MSVILITGSNSGIGMATALYLAEKGHRIYASMRDLNRGNDLQAAATAKNLSVETIRLDVKICATWFWSDTATAEWSSRALRKGLPNASRTLFILMRLCRVTDNRWLIFSRRKF